MEMDVGIDFYAYGREICVHGFLYREVRKKFIPKIVLIINTFNYFHFQKSKIFYFLKSLQKKPTIIPTKTRL